MKKLIENIFWTTLCVIVGAIAVAMMIKADIGVGSINAMTTIVSRLTGIHVGTVLMGVNIFCVFLQFVMQRQDFHWRQWLQIGVAYILGAIVNVMIYDLFDNVVLDSYWIKMIWFISGILLSAITIASIIRLNLVVFPVEAASHVVAKKTHHSFRRVRQLVDLLCIVIAVSLCLLTNNELTVREGTLVNFVFLAPLIQLCLNYLEKHHVFNHIIYH